MKNILKLLIALTLCSCGKLQNSPTDTFSRRSLVINGINASLLTDTTISTIWDGGGKVLHIENNKIHGSGTLQNWIIDAPITANIFDTSINLINIQTWDNRFSTQWYGTSTNNPDNWWNIQKSINVCAANDKLICVSLEPGVLNYSKTLDFSTKINGIYQQYYIDFEGDATYWDNGHGTTFHYTGPASQPALNAQLNKGSVFSNFVITGNWKSLAGVDSVYFTTPEANYKDQSVNNYPDNYTGFAIDFYYDGHTKSGSTGITVEDVSVAGFGQLFSFSENGYTQNDEAHTFNNIHLFDGKYGFVNHQPQEKGTTIRNIYSWGSIYNIINIGRKGGAGYYTFDGANIAGRCIEPINISVAHWFPSTISNWFCESVDHMGNFSSASTHVKVSNCTFDLNIDYNKHRNIVYSNSPAIEFDNVLVQYYDGTSSPVYWHGYATWDPNCTFGYGGKLIAQ